MNDSTHPPAPANRRIRIFISSTFRDMIEERDSLMTHAWPELRQLCRERHVELVEVDLRWGIAEEQSTRRETLKLCLDEIRACRPFFIGLLGERYGWVPGDDAFTADLREEQPWLRELHGRSVTELEILHGVLNNPDMAGRSFFYFRDPAYALARGSDFQSENPASDDKQKALKNLIKQTCTAKNIPLRENYPNPTALATLVLADLTAAIEAEFPTEEVPDSLTREAQDHEAFAEIRRRTYIGRADYFEALDCHAAGDGKPLLLLGDSGSGKSALLANWVEHWRKDHPADFILQHYIGGTADSADHWRLMTRVMAEIKRWSGDAEAVPTKHDDMLKEFPLWLAKARARAAHQGVRFILVLDALNQFDDREHARLLGWLPEHPFSGPLRLIVSTLPGEALDAVEKRGWETLRVQPLTMDERRRMIADYLARFSKKLDTPRLDRLAAASPAANPLYLKILLDDLRVTGTHDRLDERLAEYLGAADIPALLRQVLARYRRDYEHDRPGLVAEALGLIWAARRGLTETELLQLLRPADQAQLPPALWTPLRAALEDLLVDRGGILNFAHDFLRAAVGEVFVPDDDRRQALQFHLADYFEMRPITARTCDELPWLLWQAESKNRLRSCLLDIDRFLLVRERDQEEYMGYWVWLKEERTMGKSYLASFATWSVVPGRENARLTYAANELALFLNAAALHADAEPLMRRAVAIWEHILGVNHPNVAKGLNNLGCLLKDTNRFAEAEQIYRRALAIDELNFGPKGPLVATALMNLGGLLKATNRFAEAEQVYRRALAIDELRFGPSHPEVAIDLGNLARLLHNSNRLTEAETLLRRALAIDEKTYGSNHPAVGVDYNCLAGLLYDTNRPEEAESLLRRSLEINEHCKGKNHPDVATALIALAHVLQGTGRRSEAEPLMCRALEIDEICLGPDHSDVATDLSNLADVLQAARRFDEAEPLIRRALSIDETSFGPNHPNVAIRLNNLAVILRATNQLVEAEPLIRRALTINEDSFGPEHPSVGTCLINLTELLQATNRLEEAEPLMRQMVIIFAKFSAAIGDEHPQLQSVLRDYNALLLKSGQTPEQARERVRDAVREGGLLPLD